MYVKQFKDNFVKYWRQYIFDIPTQELGYMRCRISILVHWTKTFKEKPDIDMFV